MRNDRSRSALAVSMLGATILTGCSMQSLPPYDDARTETINAMQRIVDEIPGEYEIDVRELSEPAPCGAGVSYNARWTLIPAEDLDIPSFIEALPAALGDDFEVVRDSVTDLPGVYLRALEYGDAGIGVTDFSESGQLVIGLLGTSRCANVES